MSVTSSESSPEHDNPRPDGGALPPWRARLRESALLCVSTGAAFGLIEIVTAAAPSEAEPPRVLLMAVLLMAGIGGVAGLVHGIAMSVLPAKIVDHPILGRLLDIRWLAFLPPLVLLIPKLRLASASDPSATIAVCLAAATMVALVVGLVHAPKSDTETLPPDRRESGRRGPVLRRALVQTGLALGLWPLFLRIKDLSTIAELKSSLVVLGWLPWAIVAAVGVVLASVSVARERLGEDQWRSALVGAWVLFVAVATWRLLAPPAYDLQAEPVAERLGRGTPVILIVLDTTRADHLSVYGYARDTSPELEELARDSVVYEHALSVSSWTLPSHASLFTGLFPLTHGALRLPGLGDDQDSLEEKDIHRPAYPLADDFYTLPEWFGDNGYSTGAVVANFAYLDPAFRVSQGFETYYAVRNVFVEPRILRVIDRRVARLPGLARHWQVYRSAQQINQLAFRWLESQETHRFFLFLNYMEAHLPWGPHEPGLRYEKYAAEAALPAPPGGEAPDEETWRRRVDLYDSNIASMDHQLGLLFDRLKAMELYDRSLIIVTSDHGESFGENGFDGHGKSLNEAEIWIPLIVKYPGSREVGRRSESAQLVDILPTILRELGRERGQDLDFGHEIEGEPMGEVGHPLLAELYTDPRESEDMFHGYRAAIWEDGRKLVVRSDGHGRLFESPWLEKPVAETEDALEWMEGRTAGLLERWGLLEARAKERQSEAELDPELEAGLEALGYL